MDLGDLFGGGTPPGRTQKARIAVNPDTSSARQRRLRLDGAPRPVDDGGAFPELDTTAPTATETRLKELPQHHAPAEDLASRGGSGTPPRRRRRRRGAIEAHPSGEDDTAGGASAVEKVQRVVNELARKFGAKGLPVTQSEDNARGKTRSRHVPTKSLDTDKLVELFGHGVAAECAKHGGGKQCSKPGCKKPARSGWDRCTKHGGGKQCSKPGCKTPARSDSDRCTKHGGGRQCSKPGCKTPARSGGDRCTKHGGGKRETGL